jgi:hypothetical protein
LDRFALKASNKERVKVPLSLPLVQLIFGLIA